ncbi:MAG: alpha/beta hydrolase [Deltaproteobacteria bacterium]|jgi:pimeloyl-ACP methyl ester carboxylesterase|nr:alpha/beta hydrolase [Deltaproteobacteria bacterium]
MTAPFSAASGSGAFQGRAKGGGVLLLFLLPLLFSLLLEGCAAYDSRELWRKNVLRSGPRGFQAEDFNIPPFHLAGLLKVTERGGDLVVYLEGDGRGVSRGRVNPDPTPEVSMTLDLALQDPHPRVLYLARIGQYMPAYATEKYRIYWSSGRLAPPAVEAASRAIDQAKAKCGAEKVHLVGFSGGGGLAVLLAEERRDVLTLVTVAGLLDTDWWVRSRNYKPMSQSLNPADRAEDISQIPQIHFYGTRDELIPPEMSGVFAAGRSFSSLERVPVPAFHDRGWSERWPDLLERHVLPLRRAFGR